jgi:hypothetical protein
MAADALCLPIETRVAFLQARVNKALRAVRKHYRNVLSSAFHCEEQLVRLLSRVGASGNPLATLNVWNQTSGSDDERLTALLDSLTFDSAHCRIAAQLTAEDFVPLLEHFSGLEQAFAETLVELWRLERVQTALRERNRVKVGDLVYSLSKLTRFAAELSYWLPGLDWPNDLGCDETLSA